MKIHELFESNSYLKLKDLDLSDAKDIIFDALSETYEFAKQFITKNSSSPSAPDTSKYREQHSGEIKIETNFHIPGSGSYGISRNYDVFLKIGSAISFENSKKIQNEFLSIISDEFNEKISFSDNGSNITLECSDGTIFINKIYGSNWGGIGYLINKKK